MFEAFLMILTQLSFPLDLRALLLTMWGFHLEVYGLSLSLWYGVIYQGPIFRWSLCPSASQGHSEASSAGSSWAPWL